MFQGCAAFFFVLAATIQVVTSKECPAGWSRSDSLQACYKGFTEKSKITYEYAESKCNQYGGHLSSARTEEERDFIQAISRPVNMRNPPYIGLRKDPKKPIWRWAEDGCVATDIAWAVGEPNNPNDQYCTIIWVVEIKKAILDTPCSNTGESYICKIRDEPAQGCSDGLVVATAPKVPIPVKVVKPIECPTGWSRSDSLKACYKGFTEKSKITYEYAESKCNQYGGHLSSAKTEEERDFIQAISRPVNMRNPPYIGLRKDPKKPIWRWAEDGCVATDIAWAVGEPNNPNDQYCTIIWVVEIKKAILDSPCSNTGESYICKIRDEPAQGCSDGLVVASAPKVPIPVKVVKPIECLTGWSRSDSLKACYKGFTESYNITYEYAESKCNEYGGHLSTAKTEEERDFIQAISRPVNMRNPPYIGLRKDPTQPIWRWTEDNCVAKDIGWAVGEPNNPNDQYCTIIWVIEIKKAILDAPCSKTSGSYVCKISDTPAQRCPDNVKSIDAPTVATVMKDPIPVKAPVKVSPPAVAPRGECKPRKEVCYRSCSILKDSPHALAARGECKPRKEVCYRTSASWIALNL